MPDPNEFSGETAIYTVDTRTWETVDVCAGYSESGRGIGLAEMAHAIAAGRPHRATGAIAAHVLECMEAIITAARERTVVEVASAPALPEPVPPQWPTSSSG